MTKGARLWGAALATCLAGTLSVSALHAETIAPTAVEIVDMEAKSSLTGKAGDPVAGRDTFADRKKGNCLACHANADLAELLFHGEVGPELDGVGDRWSTEQLRAIVINSKQVFGDQTIMPGFYTTALGARIADKFTDKTILSAQEVEDVVAYLLTLKEN
ncbi:sulfur oxidation c-type cytochrome SoxX [Roseibium sp.]|uniref:sulfur oxidation c-type cytochrome SoxX n=1 Tax=Roseibium sp. TaxID=1936156 RepID=UPI00092C26F7|nr:sulfur oxidation c-type cytochrome SoxX [Alphaproteobacteria bacterium AO1-B]